MRRLRTLLRRRRGILPLAPSGPARGGERGLDHLDGLTAASAGDIGRGDGELGGGGGMPPASWVKSYDEGRPRK